MTPNQPERRIAAVIAVAALVLTAAGCATSSVSGRFPTAHADGGPMRLFVMPAASVGNPSTGNVGFSFVEVQRLVDDQVLAVAREEDPSAALAPVDGPTPYRPMEPYINAAAPARVTPAELNAAGYARQHGGTHLLVPTIVEWRQMRTDDPVGALMTPHNRVVIELRLVRLNPAGIEGDVTFSNHSRATFNQSADKLLGDGFRKTVKKLIAE